MNSEIVHEVCQAVAEAVKENIQVRNCICAEHTVLHIKSMGWRNETKYVTNSTFNI